MTMDSTGNTARHDELAQVEQIEHLYTLIDMAAANLSVLMAAGQQGRFLVDHETVINSLWSSESLMSQLKSAVGQLQPEYK